MNSTKEKKCVLTFYKIDDKAIFEKAYGVIWEEFVQAKVDGVSCANVFHVDMEASQFALQINAGDLSEELRLDCEAEVAAGATYVFVSPVTGDPVAGAALSMLLA